MRKVKDEQGLLNLARVMDVTPNTVRSCLAGIGMRFSTFEKLCEAVGWHVTVTDKDGRVIAES